MEYGNVVERKKFSQEVDLGSRADMVRFLKDHFRYHTMNSWNMSTSYAANMKIYNLGLPRDVEERLWDMRDADGAYGRINSLTGRFGAAHGYRWQACWNGQSDGYLVLVEGGTKDSGYRSYCTACGQRNYTSVEETGTKCGWCGKEARVDYNVPPKHIFTCPGKAVDMEEDFESWDDDELQDRVELILEFDQLCDDIVAEAVCLAETCEAVEEEYFVPAVRKVLVQKEKGECMERNIDERDRILFGEPFSTKDYPGGSRRFSRLTLKDAERLVEGGWLEKDDRQNDAPATGEIMEFVRQYPYVKMHGYAISPDRPDCRVTLEGIEWSKQSDGGEVTKQMLYNLQDLFRHASEFSVSEDGIWIWYD